MENQVHEGGLQEVNRTSVLSDTTESNIIVESEGREEGAIRDITQNI